MELDMAVDGWLDLDGISALTGLERSRVRRLLEDRAIIGVKRGTPKTFQVPEAFFIDAHPVTHLKGTLVLLQDAGFDDAEAISWLFTPDDTLPGRPIDLLRADNKGEVRRRAQALAF